MSITAQCTNQIITGTRPARRCGRRASGTDGMCGHCRKLHTPKRTFCRACGTWDIPRDTTCDEHRRTQV